MSDIRPSLFYNENEYSIFDKMTEEDDNSSTLCLLNADYTLDHFPMAMRSETIDDTTVSFPLSCADKVNYYEENGPLVLDFQRNLIYHSDVSHDLMCLSKDSITARFLYQTIQNGYNVPDDAYRSFDFSHLLSQLGYRYSECLAFSFGRSHVIIYLTAGGYKVVLYTDIWEYLDDLWSDSCVHPDNDLKEHVEQALCEDPCITMVDNIDTLVDSASSAISAVYISVIGHPSILEIEYPFVNNALVSDLLNYSETKLGVSCSLWYTHKYTGFKFHPDMNVNFLHRNLALYVDCLEPDVIKRYPKFSSPAKVLSNCYWKNDYIFVLPRRYRPLSARFYSEAYFHCVSYIDKSVGGLGFPTVDRFFLSTKEPDIQNRTLDRSVTHEQWMFQNFERYHGNNVSVESSLVWSDFFGSWVPLGRFFFKALPGSYSINGERTLCGSICVCMISRLETYMVYMSRSGPFQSQFDPGTVYKFMTLYLDSRCYSYLFHGMESGALLHNYLTRSYS